MRGRSPGLGASFSGKCCYLSILCTLRDAFHRVKIKYFLNEYIFKEPVVSVTKYHVQILALPVQSHQLPSEADLHRFPQCPHADPVPHMIWPRGNPGRRSESQGIPFPSSFSKDHFRLLCPQETDTAPLKMALSIRALGTVLCHLLQVGTMRPRFWVPDLSFMVPSLPLSLISLFVNKCSYFEYAICFPMGPWLIQPQTRFHHQTLHAAMFHHQTGKSTIFQGNKRTHAFIKPVGSVQSPFSLQWCSISVRTQQDLTILCLPRLQIMWFCHCLPKTRQSQEWHPHKGSDWSLQWTFYRKAGGRDEHTNSTEIAWSFTAIISLTCFSESWFAGRTFAWPGRHL